MTRANGQAGFTLPEMLIATAIFLIIMAAVAAVFLASVRALRTGYQSQEAYETSRGTFAVVERDLTTAFTSRDFGEYYQFYGNAWGFTMIGLIRETDESVQLGRITYALTPVVFYDQTNSYRIPAPFGTDRALQGDPDANTGPVTVHSRCYWGGNDGLDNDGDSQIDEADEQRLFNSSADSIDQDGDGTLNDPDEAAVDVPVGTAALVRYIEPGVEDLNYYPFNWEDIVTDPEFNIDLADELSDAIGGKDWTDPDVIVRLSRAEEELLNAKKRDLWIRMISGQEYWIPLLSGSPNGPELPNVYTDGWLKPNQTLNVRDYVVAENIAIVPPNLTNLGVDRLPPLVPLDCGSGLGFFRYGRVAADTTPVLSDTWNSGENVDLDTTADLGSPLLPRLPEMVLVRFPFVYDSPYPGAPHFERNLEQLIDVPTAYTRTVLGG
jgi:prepilin-type N-terminal cleavage/methylation domain-containing protein